MGVYQWRERMNELNWSLEPTYSWAERIRQTVPISGGLMRFRDKVWDFMEWRDKEE
jgi:hypothetical protein